MHSTSNIGGRCKAKSCISRKRHILSRLDVHVVGKVFFQQSRVLESAKNNVVSDDMMPRAVTAGSDLTGMEEVDGYPLLAWSSKRGRTQNHF